MNICDTHQPWEILQTICGWILVVVVPLAAIVIGLMIVLFIIGMIRFAIKGGK